MSNRDRIFSARGLCDVAEHERQPFGWQRGFQLVEKLGREIQDRDTGAAPDSLRDDRARGRPDHQDTGALGYTRKKQAYFIG